MKLFVVSFILFLVGCNSSYSYISEPQALDTSILPLPDKTIIIPNLSSCTDAEDKSISLNSTAPVTVLVHGCNGSAGRFRSLAQLYAFHGQQTVCFSYDDRDSLIDSAERLAVSLNKLSAETKTKSITVLGHSMGGLISRKALALDYKEMKSIHSKDIDLITVSAPFAGINAASHCGIEPLHWVSLGVVPSICWLITGDNWFEITSSSDFIKKPETLAPFVKRHIKIVTNEKNTCRRKNAKGKCLESDDVFEVSEQYQSLVDSFPNVIDVQVKAGHVEIVGYKDVAPNKLVSILQEFGSLSYTPENKKTAFDYLLSKLY